jgi:hypothetical protein
MSTKHLINEVVTKVSERARLKSSKNLEDTCHRIEYEKALGLNPVSNSGSQSLAVASHPEIPEFVIKVVYRTDPYLAWCEALLEVNQDYYTHFPNVESVTYVGKDKAIVVVERIHNEVSKLEARDCVDTKRVMIESNPHCDKAATVRNLFKLSEYLINDTYEDDERELECYDTEDPLQSSVKEHVELLLFVVRELHKKSAKDSNEFNCWYEFPLYSDFHIGNFMSRDNGDIVCIDPLWLDLYY